MRGTWTPLDAPGRLSRRSGSCCAPDRRSRSSSSRPKTEEGERQLWQAIRELEPLRPSFVSITYGAGGSTRDNTVARHRADRHRHHAAADGPPDRGQPLGGRAAPRHRPAGRRSASATSWPCGATRRATRSGSGSSHPEGVHYAEDLVRLVRESGDFCVGVAAFPYKHPRSPDIDSRHRATSSASAGPAPTSRSPRCSSTPTTTCGCGTGWRRPAATCRSWPASCRSPRSAPSNAPSSCPARRSRRRWPPSSSGSPTTRTAVRRARHRAGQRDVRPAARRGRAGHPLHHPQPVDRDPRGVAEPRPGGAGLSQPTQREDHRLSWDEYSARWASLHGGVDPRRSSAFVGGWLRLAYARRPRAGRLGLAPGAVTAVGLAALRCRPGGGAARRPVAVRRRRAGPRCPRWPTPPTARWPSITGRTSRLGAFYDAMADRVSEALWLLALWLAGVPGMLVAVCGAAGLAARVRPGPGGTSAGMPGIGVVTVAERPTRVIAVTRWRWGWAASPRSSAPAGRRRDDRRRWPCGLVLGLLGADPPPGTRSAPRSVRRVPLRVQPPKISATAAQLWPAERGNRDPEVSAVVSICGQGSERQGDQGEAAAGVGRAADQEQPGHGSAVGRAQQAGRAVARGAVDRAAGRARRSRGRPVCAPRGTGSGRGRRPRARPARRSTRSA